MEEVLNGSAIIEEIMEQTEDMYTNENSHYGDDEWPDSVHHQSWHDSWRNSH